MPEPTTDPQLDEFLEIRKPGAHLADDVVPDDFVLMLGVDLNNFPKFPASTTASRTRRPTSTSASRSTSTPAPSSPDYRGPYRADLRYTDFSRDALATKFLPWSEAYLVLCVDGWAAEVARRYGDATMAEIEWAAWNDQVVPELDAHARRVPPRRT